MEAELAIEEERGLWLMKGDAEWKDDQDDLAWAVDHRPCLNCCLSLTGLILLDTSKIPPRAFFARRWRRSYLLITCKEHGAWHWVVLEDSALRSAISF